MYSLLAWFSHLQLCTFLLQEAEEQGEDELGPRGRRGRRSHGRNRRGHPSLVEDLFTQSTRLTDVELDDARMAVMG